MSRTTKVWLLTAAALLLWLLLSYFLPGALGLAGSDRLVLFGGLALIGVIATGAILWWLLRGEKKAPAPAKGMLAAVDAGMTAARAALVRAKGRKAAVASMPAALVLGPTGSAKTTTVVRSGLEPSLLSGDVFRGETVAPTPAANLWLAGDTVVAEVGGALAADAGAYKRLLGHLKPRRLASAVAGQQPPRVAIVCYGLDALVAPGGAEAAKAAAAGVRAQLVEAARAFGVRLPVYLVLTKADGVAHFADFAQVLTAEEVAQPLGATFASDDGQAGTYADRAARQVGGAIDEMVGSLSEHRLSLLPRDDDEGRRLGAYELPRELRKLGPRVVELAVELCRPTQEPTGPFLRGVYFTGVQAVVLQEVVRQEEALQASARAPVNAGATMAFNAASLTAPAAAAPLSQNVVTRRVPRWVWLTGFWKDVVIPDDKARRASQGGVGLDLARRGILAGVATAALLAALLVTVSWAGNRRLQRDVVDATRALGALPPASVDLPSADALRRLDSLRVQVQRLRAYERDGAPMLLGLGLYTGDEILPEARRRYFEVLDRLVVGQARASLLSTLRGLPEAPTAADDYGRTYDALKAHLVTTSQARHADARFLTPALATHWLAGRQADAERLAIARRQLDFYAAELPVDNPYPGEADGAAVAKGRTFLTKFAGAERVYQFMLSEAARGNPPVSLARRAPVAAQYVANGHEVPGAFTKGGFTFMQGAFRNVDRFFQGEPWVVGENTGAPADKAKLVAELRTRYAADYVRQWRQFLAAGAVQRYANVRDAARRLGALAGNQSPVLQMLALASQHTGVADTAIASRFQAVHTVVAPTATDKLVSEANAPYVTALVGLQAAVDQAANAPPGQGEMAAQQAAMKASEAKVAVLQLAQGFRIDPEAHVEASVQRLLEAPIVYAEPLLRGFGAAEVNGAAAPFCAQGRSLLAKYPFNSEASQQASAAEMNALLRPGTGSLWAMTAGPLAKAVQRQGAQFVATPGTVTLAPQFVAFLNRAAQFADALYKDDSPDPRINVTVQPLVDEASSSVSITVDGQTARSTRNSLERARLAWSAATAREARLSAAIGGAEAPLLSFQGPWSLFQLLQEADAWRAAPDGYRVEWALTARAGTAAAGAGPKVAAEVNLGGVSPTVFRKGFFAGTGCPAAPAR